MLLKSCSHWLDDLYLSWRFGAVCFRLCLCHKLRAYSSSLKSPTEAQVRHLAGPREFSREITRWRERFHTGSLLITADVCQRESGSFRSYMLNAANTALLLSILFVMCRWMNPCGVLLASHCYMMIDCVKGVRL